MTTTHTQPTHTHTHTHRALFGHWENNQLLNYTKTVLKMINASALEKVKLKATAEVAKKDRSDPIFMINAVEESEEKEEKRRNYFFSTGLDRWYKSLQDVTIPSKFLNISADEARAIVSYWKKKLLPQSQSRTSI